MLEHAMNVDRYCSEVIHLLLLLHCKGTLTHLCWLNEDLRVKSAVLRHASGGAQLTLKLFERPSHKLPRNPNYSVGIERHERQTPALLQMYRQRGCSRLLPPRFTHLGRWLGQQILSGLKPIGMGRMAASMLYDSHCDPASPVTKVSLLFSARITWDSFFDVKWLYHATSDTYLKNCRLSRSRGTKPTIYTLWSIGSP